MNIISIPSLISILFCIGLGIFVFSRNPRHIANISFFLGLISLAVVEFGNFMILYSTDPLRLMFWSRVSLAGEAFIPGNWIIFSLVFARTNYKELMYKWKMAGIAAYIIPLSFLAFIGSDLFVQFSWVQEDRQTAILLLGSIGRYFCLVLLIGCIIVLLNLENTLRSSAREERWRIKYALLGVSAIFAFFLYINSQRILMTVLRTDNIPANSGVIIISLSLIVFSLVRHRLMDVNVFVSRYVLYNSVTVLFVGIYLLIVGLIGSGIKYLGIRYDAVILILFVFLAILVMSLILLSEQTRRKVKIFINKHFYKNKYDYRHEWLDLTNRLSSRLSPEDMFLPIIEMLAETMWVKSISLWLYEEERDEFHLVKTMNLTKKEKSIKGDNSLIRYLMEKEVPIDIKDLKANRELCSIYEENIELVDQMEISVCIPLIIVDKMIGFITLGEELMGEVYNYEDYDILHTMAKQIASALLSARLSQELIKSKEREAFQRFSSFILHDLKNFASMLSLVAQNMDDNIDNPEFIKDAFKTVSDTALKMKDIIARLSTSPEKVSLRCTDADLNELLKSVISEMPLNDNCKVNIIVDKQDPLPNVWVDSGEIKKVIVNILLNAIEVSPERGNVVLKTYVENGEVILAISDQGCGMSESFIKESLFKPFNTTKEGGLGVGLFHCKSIIDAHNSRIEVKSREGEGSTFEIFLPIAQ